MLERAASACGYLCDSNCDGHAGGALADGVVSSHWPTVVALPRAMVLPRGESRLVATQAMDSAAGRGG